MPHFWTVAKQPIHIDKLYQGASAFLCCSGPSLLNQNLKPLANCITMGVNNSPVALREHGGFSPNLWTMTDDCKNFVKSIYDDPQILKFLPDGKPNHKLFDNNAWKEVRQKVRDCPGVMYYRRPPKEREFFDPKTFLTTDEFCWGNWAQRCACGYVRPESVKDKLCPDCGTNNRWGSRSCMLVAIRILYELGFRKVFLLGCDFTMDANTKYAFKQDRAGGAIRNNNNTYRMLNERFDALQPVLQNAGMEVYNCFKGSGLKSFPYIEYLEALSVSQVVPADDRTEGLYDRKANEKAAKKAQERDSQLSGKPRTLKEFAEARRKVVQARIERG